MNIINCENKNMISSRTEDVLKWRLSTSCINNFESGESTNISLMDKNKFSNNNIKENVSSFSPPSTTSPSANSNLGSFTKVNYFVTLAKDSPKNVSYDSSSDTYDSFHFRETDYCKDTTDTLSVSSYTTEGIATVDVVEYDIASRSESEDLYSNDSSSGDEDIILAVATKAAQTLCEGSSSSSSDFADTEEDSADDVHKDPELSSADFWHCVKCKNKQNNPMFRYCEKCYRNRKAHFPPRPPQRKRRTEMSMKTSKLDKHNSTLKNCDHSSSLSSLSELSGNERNCVKASAEVCSSASTTTTTITEAQQSASILQCKRSVSDMNRMAKKFEFHGRTSALNSKNSSENGLNSVYVESLTSDDSDAEHSSHNLLNQKLTKVGKRIKNQSNRRLVASEKKTQEPQVDQVDFSRRKQNFKTIANFYSTPKLSDNLKRKNPFQISLENNAKRIFINNSSCSSVTNVTPNNYSSSNNSSLTTSTNLASCSNVLNLRDTNLIANDSETELALEFIGNSSNNLQVHKDSGISSSASTGPSSSQEFSSQLTADLDCNSPNFDEPCSSTLSIGSHLNTNESSSSLVVSSLNNICDRINEKILDNFPKEIASEDDTVSEELNEDDYDSLDEDLLVNNKNKSSDSKINDTASPHQSREKKIDSLNTEVDCNNLKISNYINLTKHMSEFPLSTTNDIEFSPTIKRNSIIARSVSSTLQNSYNLDSSPTTSKNMMKNFEAPNKKRKIMDQFSDSNEKNNSDPKETDVSKSDSCIVCLDEPKNGVFVHSRFLHLCCCYKCAVKIWNKNKKCPVCNCSVKNVMKLFIH